MPESSGAVAPTDPLRLAATNGRREAWRRLRVWLLHPVVIGGLLLSVAWWFAIGFGPYDQFVISLIALYAIVGAGLVLLVGVGGQLSLGHAAFLAVGAYSAANFAGDTSVGLPVEIGVALVVSVVVGVIVGLPSLRLSGVLLAVGTLALGFAGQQVLYVWESVTGGGTGMTVAPLEVFGRPVSLLTASMAVLAIALFLVFNLLRGRTGRALHALRTSDIAARSVGIEVERRRVAAFAMSAALTATGGVLYGHAVSYLSPDTFSIALSIQLVIMVIIGGQRRLLGAVLGAAFVIGVPEQFREVQDYEGILYGTVLLAVIIFAPGGVVELVDRSASFVRSLRSLSPFGRTDGLRVVPLPTPTVNGHRPVTADDAPVISAPGEPLRAQGVCVRFGGVNAVNDVSIDIAPGEILGLIGPNGAGKTTLFNAVCGFVPSTGRVEMGDRDLSRASIRRRALAGIGRTFQNLALHEGLTPVDHVLIGRHRFYGYSLMSEMLRLPHVIRAERDGVREALALLDLLGLRSVAFERGDDLPYGMQKRVDVARALASRPRVLLLDEPAAGLPHDEADALIDEVIELTRPNGTTIVVIEHNVELVRRVCDRLVVLDAGTVIGDGPPAEILGSARVVEAYLGA